MRKCLGIGIEFASRSDGMNDPYLLLKLSRLFSYGSLLNLIQPDMIHLNYAWSNVLSYSHLLFFSSNPRFFSSDSGFSLGFSHSPHVVTCERVMLPEI